MKIIRKIMVFTLLTTCMLLSLAGCAAAAKITLMMIYGSC